MKSLFTLCGLGKRDLCGHLFSSVSAILPVIVTNLIVFITLKLVKLWTTDFATYIFSNCATSHFLSLEGILRHLLVPKKICLFFVFFFFEHLSLLCFYHCTSVRSSARQFENCCFKDYPFMMSEKRLSKMLVTFSSWYRIAILITCETPWITHLAIDIL